MVMRVLVRNTKFLHAVAVLIGTMVGVGIFSIPLAMTKSGFVLGLLLALLIGGVTLLFDLMYAEIVLRTKQRHQLVGYAGRYVGRFASRVMFFANILGIYGALLVYIHFAGGFLSNIFSEFFYIQREYYSAVFFAVIASLLPFGFKTIAAVEFFLTGLFMAVIVLIFGFGVGHIDLANYGGITWQYWYLPYGVFLFAFAGLMSIPLQRELLMGQEHNLKSAVTWAVLITGALFLLFGFVVVGVSGFSTSDDALIGLVDFLGPRIIWLGSFFGLCAISTSFLMLSSAMIEIFTLDYRIKRHFAWMLVALPPFILYMGGLRSAVEIISLVGAVSIGLEAIVLLFVYRNAKHRGDRAPEFSLKVPTWSMYVFGAMFIVGIVFELFIRT